jgi:5-methyltetrahydrofolate--homocysteine methyltransferase
MADPLSDLLARQPVVVADGAMGTSLFALGLETGASPELWNLEQPERVCAVHQSFVDAGSDLILTNSFGGNRRRLSLHGAEAQVGALNRAAARLARAVADGADRPVLVAGSMGPTGEIFTPVGPLDRQSGEAAFAEQAEALAEGGCDLLWIETISAVEELEAAVAGAARTGLPVVATMTFDTHGRTMMGVTTAAAIRLRERFAVRPVAFGANCGIGPAQLVESVLGLAHAADAGDVIVAKGNCGVPHYREGQIHYDGTPEIMAAYACLARDAGARVIGGCCGTTAGHIRAMAVALASRPPGQPPERATIEAALGPMGAAPAGEATRRVRRPRRRGERA